uniref:ShKT domain-containing protein n=1 Tax=Strongyloides stercoralis TaxID=6248 RepID=A0A0K0DXZ0_STRER
MKNYLYTILFFSCFITIQSGYTTTIGNCEQGYCPNSYSCISNYCVKGSIQADPTILPLTTNKLTTSTCNDNDSKCPTITNLCNNTIYKSLMKQKCPKSCNYC